MAPRGRARPGPRHRGRGDNGHRSAGGVAALRSLTVNLFAVASKGPLSDETLRRIGTYADAIKEQKAKELLAQKRSQSVPASGEK